MTNEQISLLSHAMEKAAADAADRKMEQIKLFITYEINRMLADFLRIGMKEQLQDAIRAAIKDSVSLDVVVSMKP